MRAIAYAKVREHLPDGSLLLVPRATLRDVLRMVARAAWGSKGRELARQLTGWLGNWAIALGQLLTQPGGVPFFVAMGATFAALGAPWWSTAAAFAVAVGFAQHDRRWELVHVGVTLKLWVGTSGRHSLWEVYVAQSLSQRAGGKPGVGLDQLSEYLRALGRPVLIVPPRDGVITREHQQYMDQLLAKARGAPYAVRHLLPAVGIGEGDSDDDISDGVTCSELGTAMFAPLLPAEQWRLTGRGPVAYPFRAWRFSPSSCAALPTHDGGRAFFTEVKP